MNKTELCVNNFPQNGFCKASKKLDKKSCLQLRNFIDSKRPISNNIFYKSEEEFKLKGRYNNYAPGVGHNFLENCNFSLLIQIEGP